MEGIKTRTTVAYVKGHTRDEEEANADLIASAPALASQVRELRSKLEKAAALIDEAERRVSFAQKAVHSSNEWGGSPLNPDAADSPTLDEYIADGFEGIRQLLKETEDAHGR